MLEEQLGASRRTLLSRLGFDPDQEAAQREDEADAAAAVAERQAAAFDRGAASLER
jgi:hypothetical protein